MGFEDTLFSLLPTIFAALVSAVIGVVVASLYRRGRPRILIGSCSMGFGYGDPYQKVDVSEELQRLSIGSPLVDFLGSSHELAELIVQSNNVRTFLERSEKAIVSIDQLIATVTAGPKQLEDKVAIAQSITRNSVIEGVIVGALRRKDRLFAGICKPPEKECTAENRIIEVYEDSRNVGEPNEKHGYCLDFPTFSSLVMISGKEAARQRNLILPYIEAMEYFHSETLLALLGAVRTKITQDTDHARLLKNEFDKIFRSITHLQICATILNQGKQTMTFHPWAFGKIKLGTTTEIVAMKPYRFMKPADLGKEISRARVLFSLLKMPLPESVGEISVKAKSFCSIVLVSEAPVSPTLFEQMDRMEKITGKIVLKALSPEIFEAKFVSSGTFSLNSQTREAEKSSIETYAGKMEM